MPNTEKDRVKRWQERVVSAVKVQKAWESKYDPDKLEEYRLGHQYEDEDLGRYVINLMFPTVETKLPSLLYAHPYYRVTPRPSRADDKLALIQERAKLREDTLNSFVNDPDLFFLEETSIGLLESFSRFAVVEIGYSADWIENPDAGKPMLKENSKDPMLDSQGNTVAQANAKIESERLFIKRIPAKTWLVSANQHNLTSRCDWSGYFEWHYPEDLKKNKGYKNTKSITATGRMSDTDHADNDDAHKDMVKVYKLWSHRSDKLHVIFTEGGEKFLKEDDYDIYPFEALRFNDILDQWYPLPVMYNWVSPQDEMNDIREMQRTHRKRAFRRYGYDGSVEEPELDKLQDQEKDMQLVKLPGGQTSIWPIADAPLDGSIERAVPNVKEDFHEISGEGGEQLGVGDAETATQANIIDFRSRIRENFDRVKVARWLGLIGKKMMLFMEKRMTMDVWIKRNVDPFGPGAEEETMRVAQTWEMINMAAEAEYELECEVSVDVESLSPVTQDAERESFNVALASITNPAVAVLFIADDSGVLLKKFLKYYRITNQSEVEAIRMALAKMAAIQAGQAGAGGGASPQGAAPGPTPTNGEITQQLGQQMPDVQGLM